MKGNSMKAIVIDQFGGPEVMKLRDMPIPEPLPNEVQIEIAYASINPADWKIREGLFKDRMPYEFPIILGWDASGIVSRVGNQVSNLWVGDQVFAYVRKPIIKWGTYCEYVCFDGNQVSHKPTRLTLRESAAIPLTALTAWQSVVETAKLKTGESILIHAGAGGVGGMAIQFAKYCGAKVFTTASARHHDYVMSLGADVVIDYRSEDFAAKVREIAPNGVDVVFDTIGGDTLKKSYKALKSGGRLVSLIEHVSPEEAAKHQITAYYVFVQPNGPQLKTIAGLIDAGVVAPPVIEEYHLEQAKEALEKVKSGRTQGKVVLKVR
jgi:NADPH:quinone reductase-like Zn-dependent oxidoreductase